MKKIIRVSTVPLSLKTFCLDLFDELRGSYDLLAVSSPGDDLDVVARRGTRVRSVKMERQISLLADIRALFSLVRLFRNERPDMVHSITPKAGLLSMMAALIAGVPVRLHSYTGLVFPTATGLKRKVLIATDKITCACATHIHAEGAGVRSDLLNGGITKKPITVLGHGNIRGIDFDHFVSTPDLVQKALSLRHDYGVPDGTLTFLFVGRLVRDKGIVELIEAYRRLRADGCDVSLLLVGVEEEGDALPPDIRAVILEDPTIHFTKRWVDDVRPYYEAADVLVFPSYREGFPNVVLEAGAFSLPAIVTDINGSREIVSDGINGIIVQPRQSTPLYHAMKSLVGSPAAIKEMGESALKNVKEKFDARDIRQALKNYYSEILNES